LARDILRNHESIRSGFQRRRKEFPSSAQPVLLNLTRGAQWTESRAVATTKSRKKHFEVANGTTLGHISIMLCMSGNPIELAPDESLTHRVGSVRKDGKQFCSRCEKLLTQKPFGPWTEGLYLTERRSKGWTEWKVERRRGDRGSAGPHAAFGD
jgi:hypothetical protein